MRWLLLLFSASAFANVGLESQAHEIALQNNIQPALLKAICRVESHWRPSAIGDDGASIGLCQIQINTALGWYPGFMKGASNSERREGIRRWLLNPQNNMNLSAKLLRYYLTLFNENEVLAVMAYNGGPNHPLIRYYKKARRDKDDYEGGRN